MMMIRALLWGLFSLLPVFSVPFLLVLYRDSSVWPAVLVYHTLCWIIPLASRCSLQSAGFVAGDTQRWFRRTLLLGLVLLAGGELVHYLIVIGILHPWWDHVLKLMQPWHWYMAYSLLVNPVTEEFYWRGFLLKRMGVARNAWLFWIFHTAVVMVFDEPLRAIWFTLPVLAFGFLCAWMRRQYGSLWPCILVHLAADAAILRAASAGMIR